MSDYFYRGSKLPHWYPSGATFFITIRLYGSIPMPVIAKLKAEYNREMAEIAHSPILIDNPEDLLPEELKERIKRIHRKKEQIAGKRHFARFDAFLDSNLNEPYWLRRQDIARLNFDNFHHYAKRYFDLWAFTIMSNHAHLLLTPHPDAPILWKIMQDMKKYSGLHSNRLLGRTGRFWEDESYDHWLRPGEFDRIMAYILNNPVKAGMVKEWDAHPWSYCHPSRRPAERDPNR